MTHTERTVLCYLRTHRRVWGLTQQELASLLGFESAAHVSRIENGKRAPTVESALACQVIFGIPPSAMFPHAYDVVEERVVGEVYRRHEALADTTSPSDLRKRELFSLALERAISSPNT
jgi:transcriptional regulator with XRE-family HTH domain